MKDDDFDELAAMWCMEPSPDERAAMERAARKARRQGRIMAYADWAMAGLVVVGSVAAAFAARSTLLLIAALAIMAATIWLNWRRRAIRQISRGLDAVDQPGFIAGRIRIAESNRRRVTLTLITFPIFVPAVVLYRSAARASGDPLATLQGLSAWAQSPRGLITLAILTALMVFFTRARRRHLLELRHLRALQQAYLDESRLDDEPAL